MLFSAYFPQVVLFGDSIVQDSVQSPSGLVPGLQRQFVNQFDVVNRGFRGYVTGDAVQIEDAVFNGLGGAPVEWTVLDIGTDEAAQSNSVLLPFLTSGNLEALASTALQHSRNLVIVGPGILNEDLVNGSNYEIYEYGQVARTVAALYNVPFVDTWSIFRTFLGEDPDLYAGAASTFEPLVVLNDSASNVSFSNSVNRSNFDISSAVRGFVNRTANDSANAAADFEYLGEQGNPANSVLSLLLTDGYHYTDLGYQLLLEALVPLLNITAPVTVIPDYTTINSTETLPLALAKDYVTSAQSWAQLYIGAVVDPFEFGVIDEETRPPR